MEIVILFNQSNPTPPNVSALDYFFPAPFWIIGLLHSCDTDVVKFGVQFQQNNAKEGLTNFHHLNVRDSISMIELIKNYLKESQTNRFGALVKKTYGYLSAGLAITPTPPLLAILISHSMPALSTPSQPPHLPEHQPLQPSPKKSTLLLFHVVHIGDGILASRRAGELFGGSKGVRILFPIQWCSSLIVAANYQLRNHFWQHWLQNQVFQKSEASVAWQPTVHSPLPPPQI